MSSKRKILCFAYDPWDEMWKQIQMVMFLLSARGSQVLFVNPELSLMRLITTPLKELKDPIQRNRWLEAFFKPVRKYGENLHIISPIRILPFTWKSVLIWKLDNLILQLQIRLASFLIGFRPSILWINSPAPELLNSYSKIRTRVFNWSDDWAKFSLHEKSKKETRDDYSLLLLKKSDLIFSVSKALHDRAIKINPKSYWIPNGTNAKLFSQVGRPDIPMATEMKKLQGKVLGYVGIISNRIDFELIAYLSRLRPEWWIVFIGPVMKSLILPESIISGTRRVQFLGPKPYFTLPQYMSRFDVCILPHHVDEATEAMDPIKLYDYIATGKPVVSTPVSGSDRFKGMVSVGESQEEFLACIDSALSEIDPLNAATRRLQSVALETWDARVDLIENVFADNGI